MSHKTKSKRVKLQTPNTRRQTPDSKPQNAKTPEIQTGNQPSRTQPSQTKTKGNQTPAQAIISVHNKLAKYPHLTTRRPRPADSLAGRVSPNPSGRGGSGSGGLRLGGSGLGSRRLGLPALLFTINGKGRKPVGNILLIPVVRCGVGLSGRPPVSARAAVRLGSVAGPTPGPGFVVGCIAAAAVPERCAMALPTAAGAAAGTPRAVTGRPPRMQVLLSTAPFLVFHEYFPALDLFVKLLDVLLNFVDMSLIIFDLITQCFKPFLGFLVHAFVAVVHFLEVVDLPLKLISSLVSVMLISVGIFGAHVAIFVHGSAVFVSAMLSFRRGVGH